MANTYHVPTMEYSIKVNGASKESGEGTVSFNENYNVIAITYKCTNQSINKYQVWVTFVDNYPEQKDWGKGIGKCALDSSDALAMNTNTTKTILASSSVFNSGDGLYRLALCARGDIDNTWDVTEILFTVNGLEFKPTDSDDFETIVSDSK